LAQGAYFWHPFDTFVEQVGMAKGAGRKMGKAGVVKGTATLKRKPSASGTSTGGTLTTTIQSLKDGVAIGEVGDTNRDKGKAEKAKRDREQLPPHIVSMLDDKSLSRKEKTKAINSLYTLDTKSGTYTLNAKEKIFEEYKKSYEKKFGLDQHEAVPKSIMKGSFFNNSEDAFQEALKLGEIRATVSGDGQQFYAFRKLVAGTEKGSVDESRLTGQKKVSAETAQAINDVLSKSGWDFNFATKKAQAALANGTIPSGFKDILTKGIDAQEKLAKDAGKLLSKFESGSENYVKLKRGITKTQTAVNMFRHILEWEEMPDESPCRVEALNQLLYDTAIETEQFNLDIETSKGSLKAKAK